MDPKISETLLTLLGGVPGAETLPQQFPLLFSDVKSSESSGLMQQISQGPQVTRATKVGTQVNEKLSVCMRRARHCGAMV